MSQFNNQQWAKISTKLDRDESGYGFPARRSGSLVLSSFNIRKFGRLKSGSQTKRSAGAWKLLVRYCQRCDFVAIQEVLDDLSSLLHLRNQLGPKYGLVVSDTAGGVPGRSRSQERLAFLFRNDRIEQTGLSSDISFERSAIVNTLYEHRTEFFDAFTKRNDELKDWETKNAARIAARKRKLSKPPFVLPRFVQFIRTPLIASFQAKGIGAAEPYRFLAINAHLLYGDKSKQREERWMEFKALLDWLLSRAQELDRGFEPNLFLFGDLNLDLEDVDRRRIAIEKFLKSVNNRQLANHAKINVPFLDPRPNQAGAVFRTNARRDQTYDQIALIAHDMRLPPPHQNDQAGQDGADCFDYGMFDFVRLFLDAVPAATKPSGKPEYNRFEYDVSDHMPIWIRLQKPTANQQRFRWR